MNVANKPLPEVGKASDGRVMHYSAGAIVENEKGEIFLLDRRYEPYGFAGMAGHIDKGGMPYATVIREGKEEMGTRLMGVDFILEEEVPWNHCRNDGVTRIEVHHWYLYRAKVNSRDVRVDKREATRWGWYPKEEIRVLVLEPVWEYWFKKVGIIPA